MINRSTSLLAHGTLAAATLALVAGALQGAVSAPATAAEPTAPSAPTSVSARAGVNQAKVYFAAPTSDGGAGSVSYTATSVPEGKTCTSSAATSCYVTGLTNGQAYTFDVTATNAVGTSPAATTNTVTPGPDTTDPVLVSSEVTPNRVSSLGGASVTVTLRITDDRSGHDSTRATILFDHRTSDGTFGFGTLRRISGDEYDGVYSAGVTVPAGTAAGDWDLSVYPIRDNAGNSTFFLTRPGLLVGAPQPPTGVTATLDATTPARDVTVTWTPPTDNGGNVITGYRITDSHTGTSQTVTGTTWTGTFSDISATEDLTFTVVAVNSAGTSIPSATSTPITVPAAAPSAARNVIAVRGSGQAQVSWDPPTSTNGAPVTGYTVTASPGGATVEVTASTTTATVTGLTNGTAYTFTVTATNTAGTSPGATSPPVTPADVPDPVTDVTATPGDRSATVGWTAPASTNGAPVTGYAVTASPGGPTVDVAASTTTATVPGLSNGTTYTFTVVATNEVGASPASAPSSAVTPAAPPLAVTGVRVVRGDKRLTVHWTPAEGNGSPVTGYVVSYNGASVTVGPGESTTTLTGLSNGTTYQVRVAAVNALGTGADSAPVPGTPAGKPGAVAKPIAKVKGRTLTLIWKVPATNGARILGYVITGAKPASKTVGASVRKLVFKNLKPGLYKVRVTARNAVGTGPASPVVKVTVRR